MLDTAVPPLYRFAKYLMMDPNHQVADVRRPSLNQRSLGVAIVAAIHAAQLIALDAIRVPLQQSVLFLIFALIILGVGWISSGLILGGTVLSRSFGRWRFIYGLAVALFMTFQIVVGFFMFWNSLPPSYQGP